jgi:hypothetical protein
MALDILVNTVIKAEFYKIKGLSPTAQLIIIPVMSYFSHCSFCRKNGCFTTLK